MGSHRLRLGGFSLCAFIVAALASYLKNRDQETRLRIETAPPARRPELIEKTLAEVIHVDTSGLTQMQQYEIVMKKIAARIERFRIVAVLVVVFAVLGTGLSAFAIYRAYGLPQGADAKSPQPSRPATAGLWTGAASSERPTLMVRASPRTTREQFRSFRGPAMAEIWRHAANWDAATQRVTGFRGTSPKAQAFFARLATAGTSGPASS